MTRARPEGQSARRVEVTLGARSYTIHIGPGVLHDAGTLLRGLLPSQRAIVVTNAVVSAHWLAALRAALESCGISSDTVIVPDGETHKSMRTLDDVLTRMLELNTDRATTVVALGGGVVGDLAGFAAAVYQRGVPYVQVPTTLLAQVDSSVGGKTAVNHPLGKNMIGAFYQPLAVLADTDCLRTLPPREFGAGIAEVVKYGAAIDATFFAWLEQNIDRVMARDAAALTHAIAESCRLKADIVRRDERETGERALLNFGHTFGHAIETGAGYGEWLHGEAVAAGMLMAAELSARRGELSVEDCARLRALLERAHLPVEPPHLGARTYRELMQRDKKVLSGAMRFVLLKGLGRAYVATDVAQRDLDAVLT